MAPFFPALLLALFAAWSGTYDLGTTAAASSGSLVALFGTLLWIGSPRRDPLGLGPAGRLLPLALWISMAASAWASPVPRAGKMGVLLFPAFLFLPGAVARCWRDEEDRRRGLRAVALVTAGISLWALVDWLVRGLERPALPLGHHNLLAAWLVIVLPLALLPVREPGPWRVAGIAGGALAVLTIFATRSLAGTVALAVEAFVLVLWWKRRQKGMTVLLVLLALAGLATQVPRLARIATGEDPSVRSRAVYFEAGWEGFLARPALGWGPGSTPWTVSAFLDPVPGVSPRTEAVGDLHSLPLQIAYELGLPGILLAAAVAAVFVRRRLREPRHSEPLLAGLLGLVGGAVAFLASGAIAVTALPLAAAVAAGAALSTSGEEDPGSRLPSRIYALLALLALAPSELARWRYDRARAADVAGQRDVARTELARAVALDPSFPLYRLRLALLGGENAPRLALRAAEDGFAVPVLWTVAGILGYAEKEPWAGTALTRACRLDPLDPLSPFYLALADPRSPAAPVHGAHALLAEPRLAGATVWGRRDLERTLEEVRRWPGVDPGWKEALITAARISEPRRGPDAWIELEMDTDETLAGQSLSLPIFRRRPWPLRWKLIRVREDLLEGLADLPPAVSLRTTSADVLHCSAGWQPLLIP
jgi:O-antigen ligase